MKNFRMPIPYRAVAILRDKLPLLRQVFTLFRMIFENIFIKSIIMVSYPVVAFILGRTLDFKKYPLWTKDFFIEIQLYLYVSAVYLVLYICFLFVEQYSKYYVDVTKSFLELLNKINVLQRDISSEILYLHKNLNSPINFSNGNISNLHIIMENNSLIDKIGGHLCTAIYEWLKETSGKTYFNVSYMQRFKNETNGEYIEMIAYKNDGSSQPALLGTQIRLYDGTEKKYHCRQLFENNVGEMQVLINRSEIDKKFTFEHLDANVIEEKRTKQYVSIPIKINGKTAIMFQITSEEEGIFGNKKTDIKRNMKVLYPIVNTIQPFFYKDFMMKELCYNVANFYGRSRVKGK